MHTRGGARADALRAAAHGCGAHGERGCGAERGERGADARGKQETPG
ncbi:hypothetical protein [uncultured Gulosibacter sp.]|nr:hypothetical protein [uncultured Gulosibacter sp.]